tara:strand:+ start:585 stop:1508 length:924 start_codon:yes stop_codon:yes gene_type:complete
LVKRNKINYYSAFDLIIGSQDINLPELKTEKKWDSIPDVEFLIKNKKNWIKDKSFSYEDDYLKISKDNLYLHIPEVADYYVSNGERIFISPIKELNKNNNSYIKTYLLGSAIGALLIQRGRLLLHGNALEKEGEAIVCLGDSGVGKSTLAYLLMQKGWKLISDDLVAIDNNGYTLPGIPRIKLWEDAVNFFNLEKKSLIQVAKGFEKYTISKNKLRISCSRTKVKKVFLLNRSFSQKNIECKQIISEKECFKSLINNYYRPLFVKYLLSEYSHFLLVNKLIKILPFYNIYLPNNLDCLSKNIEEYIF